MDISIHTDKGIKTATAVAVFGNWAVNFTRDASAPRGSHRVTYVPNGRRLPAWMVDENLTFCCLVAATLNAEGVELTIDDTVRDTTETRYLVEGIVAGLMDGAL